MDISNQKRMTRQFFIGLCLLFLFSFKPAFAESEMCYLTIARCDVELNTISEEKLLAAIAYGEASLLDNFEEMAGIANATIRRRNAAHMPTVNALVQKYKNFSYVVFDGNERYNRLLCAESDVLYEKAYLAARNALSGGFDYAFGGCFWDGYDLKTQGKQHMRYKKGFHFIDPGHNVLRVQEPPLVSRIINGKTYLYMFDSTAGYGKTIFWKLNKDYLHAAGAGQCL